MNRRSFLTALSAAIPFSTIEVRHAAAQDRGLVRALEAAQADRPASIASSARIAPESEPGTPLIIRGRVLDAASEAASNAIVFAYHTDREGLYDRPGSRPHSWRLRGWARTDALGRFEFRTIRPAEYPSRTIPAHVHFTVFTADARYHAGELRFDDDALVREDERQASTRAGEFGRVRSVKVVDGRQEVEFAIRLDPAERF